MIKKIISFFNIWQSKCDSCGGVTKADQFDPIIDRAIWTCEDCGTEWICL